MRLKKSSFGRISVLFNDLTNFVMPYKDIYHFYMPLSTGEANLGRQARGWLVGAGIMVMAVASSGDLVIG